MNRFSVFLTLLILPAIVNAGEVPYTHVVRTKSELCTMPKKFKNAKELSEGTLVTIIDSTKIFGFIYGKESPWIKIKTQNGDTGYLLLGEISSLAGYSKEKEGVAAAKSKPLPNFKRFISQSYTDISQIDSMLHGVEFITLDSNYTLSSWAFDQNENYVIFLLSKIIGYSGQNPLSRLTDVLVVDKRLFKDIAAISLRDCHSETKDLSIIGAYSENARKYKNGEFAPQKAWAVDKKTRRIVDIPATRCSCSPEPVGE
jgi:hypothetical protein